MRIGTVISVPDKFSQYGRIKDDSGNAYTVEPGQLSEETKPGDEFAYRVEIWGNDSGVAYDLEKK